MAVQNYANHRYRPLLWLIAALSAVLGFVLIVLTVLGLRQPSVIGVGLLLIGFSLICVVWIVRQYAVRLQDRIIRSMQTRLARLGAPADLGSLTLGQIVACVSSDAS